jgi:hypothetical protein
VPTIQREDRFSLLTTLYNPAQQHLLPHATIASFFASRGHLLVVRRPSAASTSINRSLPESKMTGQADHYQYYNNYNHTTQDNNSPNLSVVGSKNRRKNKNGKPITAKRIARMAHAENESVSLQQYLRQRKWLPKSECDSEQQRKIAMKSLETVLCQWASSLQSIRPTSQNKWQRPRGEKVPSMFLKCFTRSHTCHTYECILLLLIAFDTFNCVLLDSHFGLLWELPLAGAPS